MEDTATITDAAARSGDACAQFDLGYFYCDLEENRDPELSVFWLARAARQGHPEAMFLLGQLIDSELGPVRDPQQAVHWYRLATAAGHRKARKELESRPKAVLRGAAPESGELNGLRAAAGFDDPAACFRLAVALAAQGSVDSNAESLEWMSWAAHHDHPSAHYSLARHYADEGDGVPARAHLEKVIALGYAIPEADLFEWKTGGYVEFASEEEAVEMLREGARQGINRCRFQLAGRAMEARGLPADPKLAVSLYETAAAQGHAPSMAELAVCYRNGIGVEQDLAQASRWFAAAANAGEPKGDYGGGVIERNLGLAADDHDDPLAAWSHFETAAAHFERAATMGHAQAMYALGLMYLAGQGLDHDELRARELIAQAARAGQPDAQHQMGDWSQDEEAVYWYEQAADGGHAVAMLRLGAHLIFGKGVAQDFDCGFRWTRQAAVLGVVDAMVALARIYEMGPEGVSNPEAALEWYRKAADAGSAEGNLGIAKILFMRHEGPAAWPYLERAEAMGCAETDRFRAQIRDRYAELESLGDQGDIDAMLTLARMIDNGETVHSGPQMSSYWYEKAACKGNPEACYIFARRLLDDPRGQDHARMYLEQAAQQGNAEAAALLDSMPKEAPPATMPDAAWSDDPLTQSIAGDVSAQFQLGFAHFSGVGAKKSLPLCYFWLKIVSRTMPEMAGQMVDMVGQQIGKVKRTELDRAASTWTPGTPPPKGK